MSITKTFEKISNKFKKIECVFNEIDEITKEVDLENIEFDDCKVTNSNGHLSITGDFKSIAINGKRIRNIREFRREKVHGN